MSRIRIFHNNDPRDSMCFGYRPTDTVTEVFAYDTEPGDPSDHRENAFRLCNVGDDPEFGEPDQRAIAYRQARNRSLSTGDLVSIQDGGQPEQWWAVASFGWDRIEPAVVKPLAAYGTTPLASPEPA